MALIREVVFVIYLFSSIKTVQSGGRLSLRFVSFDNPGNRQQNGRCCDSVTICINKCDIFFRLCMSLSSQTSCSLLNIHTNVLGHDNFNFGASLGNGHTNPIVYSFSQWTEPFRIKITSLDNDGKNLLGIGSKADTVSINEFNTAHTPDSSDDSAVIQSKILRGYRSVLKLNYKIYCDKGYFKPSCTEYCKTANDSGGHYTCDFDNSRKICMSNWYGPNCTTFCLAQNNKDLGYYTCGTNGTKICLPRWYGTECKKRCIARDDTTGHFSCGIDGSKVCLPNWCGEYCLCYCKSNANGLLKCLKNGTNICTDGWFGANCSRYCNQTNKATATYACSKTGTKICFENWYGMNCDVYCKDNTSVQFTCDAFGAKICNAGWYGINCSRYTGCIANTSDESRYYCDNVTGNMVCKDGWTGDGCQQKTGVSLSSKSTILIKPRISTTIDIKMQATSSLNQNVAVPDKTSKTSPRQTEHNKNEPLVTSSTPPWRQKSALQATLDPTRVANLYGSGSASVVTTVVNTKIVSRYAQNGPQSSTSEVAKETSRVQLNLLRKSSTFHRENSDFRLVRTSPAHAGHSSSISDSSSKLAPLSSKTSTKVLTHTYNVTNRMVTSQFRIMAYVCGPFLLLAMLLLAVVGIKRLSRSLMYRSSKVKKIKLDTEFSVPLMTTFLKSTRIPNDRFHMSEPINGPRPHDSLLGYRDV